MSDRSLTFSAGGGDYKSVPPGSHVAVCDMVVNLGLQPGSAAYPTPKRQVYIRWQIPAERLDDGRPMTIGATFTASMNRKATLRLMLEGWRGRQFTDAEAESFDIAKLIGKACMLSVIERTTQDGRVRSVVSGTAKLPKGMEAPPLEGTDGVLYLNIGDAEDQRAREQMPAWLREKIDSQLRETPASQANDAHDAQVADFHDDAIPF